MTIKYKRGFLAVGFRQSDWTTVWFKPYGDMHQDDHYQDLPLYKNLNDKEESLWREPIDGEVLWYPWYDWNTMEAKGPKNKKLMQKWFLSDAYRYCSEPKKNASEQLELKLGSRGWRWQTWLTEAKRWRKGKYRDTVRRKPDADPTTMDYASTDDSTYETDKEAGAAAKKGEGKMGPPDGPNRDDNGSINAKRKRGSNRNGAAKSAPRAKKTRTVASNASPQPSFRPRESSDDGIFVREDSRGLSPDRGRSPGVIDGVDGVDPYEGGDESDKGESHYSLGAPSPLPRDSNSRASRSDVYGSRDEGGDDDDDDAGSRTPSPAHAGPRPGPRTPINPGGAAAAMATPPTTNGNSSYGSGSGRALFGNVFPRRDERGASVNNPVSIDEEEDEKDEVVDQGRLSNSLTREGADAMMQAYRQRQQASFEQREHEYQPADLDPDEALQQAMRASMVPEERQVRAEQRTHEYQPEGLDHEEAIQQAMRASMAPDGRSSHQEEGEPEHEGQPLHSDQEAAHQEATATSLAPDDGSQRQEGVESSEHQSSPVDPDDGGAMQQTRASLTPGSGSQHQGGSESPITGVRPSTENAD